MSSCFFDFQVSLRCKSRRGKMKSRTLLLVPVLLAVFASTAGAHPHPLQGPGMEHGLAAGFFHPLLGLDHLLAMFAVGLLAAQLGGRAVWVLPASFLGAMLLGGGLGLVGLGLPGMEIGIALSVVALGVALAAGRKYPLVAAALIVGLFGITHGHAHGTEMPALAAPVLYGLGFIFASAGLNLTGLGLGLMFLHGQRDPFIVRVSGAAISLAGLVILWNVV
jgi:urease accessory protein